MRRTKEQRPLRRARRPGRSGWALVEVAIAFTLMHAGFRLLKLATPVGAFESRTGIQLSPGLTMLAVGAAATLLIRRRIPLSCNREKLASSIRLAGAALLVFCAVYGIVYGVVLGLDRLPERAGILALANVVLAATAWRVLRRSKQSRDPRAFTWLAAGVLACPGLALVATSPAEGLVTVAWISLGTGIGEEFFFRGYVQGRLDLAFGRRWLLWGTRFGPGLFIASALFGLVHLLNTCDYLRGSCRLDWGHGLTSATSLVFGFLRARTGSFWAPAMLHAATNLLGRLR